MAELPKETEQKIAQLQLYEQSLQNILMQKQQFQSQSVEIGSALKELESTEKAYKIVGNIMVASKKEDHATALMNVLRVLELHENPYRKDILLGRQKAALLLFQLGDVQAGDKVMLDSIDCYDEISKFAPNAKLVAIEVFMGYCLITKQPEKGVEFADELLDQKPDNILALTVKMWTLEIANNIAEAKEIARTIYQLEDNKKALAYKMASRLLETNVE